MNKTVSIAKGVGILLMVIGHSGCPSNMRSFIYVFHMPLFFFLSGYCFKEKYLLEPGRFILRKIKTIYWPFVKYALLFLFLHNIFFYLEIYNGTYGYNGNTSVMYSPKDVVVRAFNIITRMIDNEQLLGGFWFLKQLLLASVIGFFFIKLFRNSKWKVFFLVIVTFLIKWMGVSIPFWHIGWLTFLSATFFVAGYDFSKTEEKNSYSSIIMSCLVVLACSLYYDAEMSHYTLSSMLPCIFSAVFGCIGVFYFSKILSSMENVLTKFLTFIGNHTMPILIWHFLCFKLVSLVIILVYSLPVEQLAEFPVIETHATRYWWLAYVFIGSTLPLLLDSIKEKFVRVLS